MRTIYLDNGATTQPSEGVIAKMTETLRTAYGNPSSLHRKGQEAEKFVIEARERLASYLKVEPSSIFFTSCGTESSNTAIYGAARKNIHLGRHILTAMGEHPATAEPLKRLAQEGYEIEYLDLDASGRIRLESLEEKIRPDTVLVTCLHVNNETGVIQPVDKMGAIIKKKNARTLFHVDAVQSFAKMPILPKEWQIDTLSCSAHKFHGPKGIGCLYIRRSLVIQPFIVGGGQEKKMRSGTENVPAIAGMGQAVFEAVQDLKGHEEYVRSLKKKLFEGVMAALPDVELNGPAVEDGASHVLNLRIKGVRSEVLLHALEDYGIYISSGSACASNKPEEKSPALSALGLDAKAMDESVRFSFSVMNTPEDIEDTLAALQKTVPVLRRFVRK